jgi:ABC-type Mn2+/Zn2+ transport system permease subunit
MPVEWLLEPFSYGFMRQAFAAGILTVIMASLVGTWVVMRGLTFMGDALAHGALPGIALAFLLGTNLMFGAVVSALVMIAGVSTVSARSRLGNDVAIGLLFAGMLAAGVVIISLRGAYAGDLTAILFGDLLGVTVADLRVAFIATGLVIAVTLLGYRPFLALTFSPAKAQVLGFRPRLTHVVMLGLITVVLVSSFRTVGTLLVFAFLVAPPATAALVARRVPVLFAVSILVGSAAVVAGLIISYWAATATAATIAGISVFGFFVVLTAVELRGQWSTRRRVAQEVKQHPHVAA